MVITKEGRGRPSRISIYAAVEQATTELNRIGGLPRPDVAEDIWAGIWYEETHNSTAIEGNTLILKEVRELLETGQPSGCTRRAATVKPSGAILTSRSPNCARSTPESSDPPGRYSRQTICYLGRRRVGFASTTSSRSLAG